MRNSDPRVRIVFVYKFNSNSHSIFTLQMTGCNFQYGPSLGVPSDLTFRVSWFFISWQSVLTTSHWICELWELFSVFRHEILSDFNCFKNPASVQNLITRSCCDSLSTRSWCFCNWSSRARSSVEGVIINELVGTNKESRYTIHTILRLLRRYWAD